MVINEEKESPISNPDCGRKVNDGDVRTNLMVV